MNELVTTIRAMHADPETLSGAPTNEEIIGKSEDLKRWGPKTLTEGERQGFLEMWRAGYVRELIQSYDDEALNELRAATDRETDQSVLPEQRAKDLRFVDTIARNELAIRAWKESTK